MIIFYCFYAITCVFQHRLLLKSRNRWNAKRLENNNFWKYSCMITFILWKTEVLQFLENWHFFWGETAAWSFKHGRLQTSCVSNKTRTLKKKNTFDKSLCMINLSWEKLTFFSFPNTYQFEGVNTCASTHRIMTRVCKQRQVIFSETEIYHANELSEVLFFKCSDFL